MCCFKNILLGIVIILIVLTKATSFGSNAAIRSDIYHDIEYLSAYGLIDSAILGIRPLDRTEIARLVVEATKNAEHLAVSQIGLPRAVNSVLQRLREEFKDEIAETGTGYIKPLRRSDLIYSHLKGNASTFPDINAFQEPFNYNSEGISLKEDNLLAGFEGDARYGALSFHVNPLLTYKNSDDFDTRVQRGYGKVYIGRFSIQAGKDSLWWGQGRHGSLILTNNAEPFNLIRLSNEIPFNLPLLGLFRVDFFITRLEQNRDFPEPYFGGLRLSFKPMPWFEFGLSRTAITGGKGMPSLRLSDIGTILIGRNLEGKEKGESNQIAGGDIRIRINPLKAYIYGEAAGEDEAGILPYKWAYIVGIYCADILGADLRMEYADTAFQYPGWYTHGVYTSGYTYKERVIGHHMGGDAKDIFIGTSFFLKENTKFFLHYDYEERGLSRGNPEVHHEFVLTLKQQVLERIELSLRGGYEQVKNYEYYSGRDSNNSLLEFSFESRW